jgi:hypothetical protein
MTEPTIIRCTALTGWPDCPRRGAARLFGPEVEAAGYRLRHTIRGIGAAIGTAVHSGAAIVLGEKARSGKLPPESVATDAAQQTMRDQLMEGVTYEGTRGVTINRAQAERQVTGMTQTYHRVIAPQVEPLMSEQKLEAEIEPGLILSGHPDIICREPGAVRDLKTGARPGGTHTGQIGGYALLARSNHIDIEVAAVDFIQRVPIHKPQPDPVTKPVLVGLAESTAVNVIKHVCFALAMFRHGDPARRISPGDPAAFLANPSSMLCSPKYCPAFGTEFCHEGDPAKAR